MTIEELQGKLGALIAALPEADFDSVDAGFMGALDSCAGQAEKLGMKAGKRLIENLAAALRVRQTGGNTDESIVVRLTALNFYVKNLQNGGTEDL
ncbi:MAG: hypothetical protein LBG84_03450 [Treponema sp.]|jgi:hypothetical protein|nr:hypothetical protein [Treponema sp.]